jgi:hypothetical protein
MKHLNERTQIKDAIKNFVATYGLGTYGADRRGKNIGEELLALDPETATASEISKIIGNTAWCAKRVCDECGTVTWDIVEIGEPPYYESATAEICIDCLKKAVQLIDENDLRSGAQ